MDKSYQKMLLDPNIPYDAIIKRYPVPQYLYKYQNFYSEKMEENKYWRDNIKGAFHLSLGCEFEDKNDCKPYINKDRICNIIRAYLKEFGNAPDEAIENELSKMYEIIDIKNITSNYQTGIRIGCFTTKSNNYNMWKKYANNETGFCIEYNTTKNKLFKYSTLPVLYTDTLYDISLPFAQQIIIECSREKKHRSVEEQIDIYGPIYQKIIKLTYLPIFIKDKESWGFEQEYRMFLMKNRATEIGILKSDDILDCNYNINLSDSISAIYLGSKFDKNINSENIKHEISQTAQNKKIKVFQKKYINGLYIDERII